MASEATVEDKTVIVQEEVVSAGITNVSEVGDSKPDDLQVKEKEKKLNENIISDVNLAKETLSESRMNGTGSKKRKMQIEIPVSDTSTNADEVSFSKPEDGLGQEEEKKIDINASDDVSKSDEAISSTTEDTKGTNQESKIELDDIKEKDEQEEVNVGDSSTVETPTVESEQTEGDSVIEEVKGAVEDTSTLETSRAEPEQKESGNVIEEVKEEAVDQQVSETCTEAKEKEVIDKIGVPRTPELSSEVSNEVAEQPAEVLEALPTIDSTEITKEPPAITEEAKSVEESSEASNVVEKPAEVSETSEDSVETIKEPAIPEVITEETEGVEESSDISVEPPSVNLVQESDPVTTVIPHSDEITDKPSSDVIEVIPELPKEEVSKSENSESIAEDKTTVESSEAILVVPSADEPKEAEETIVPEPSTEKKDDDHTADTEVSNVSDTNNVSEVAAEPEVNVENENADRSVDTEKPTLSISEATETVAEKILASVSEEVKDSQGVEVIDGQVKNGSVESEKPTLVETSRDIDLVGAESNNSTHKDPEPDSKNTDTDAKSATRQTLLDKIVNESSEDKKPETEPVNNGASVGAPKESSDTKENGKKSQSQGNNIISKVKKSIGKVKKAIIGKSPNSKTMAPEGNDDVKSK